MKKIIFVLVALVLASPAWADVLITCEATGCDVEIGYDATSEAGLVRAFALDITVDAGTITAVDCVSTDYGIYPGSIEIDESGTVTDYGSCACDSSYPGTLGGIGTAGVTVEMGSLYEVGVDPAPAKEGVLVRVTVSENATVTIDLNAIRGGIVMEDPDQAVTTNLPAGCTAPCSDVCLGDVSDTGGFGLPDTKVDIGDLNAILIEMMGPNSTGPPFYEISPVPLSWGVAGDCTDTGGFGAPDGKVDIGDLNAILIAMMGVDSSGPPLYEVPCM